MFNERHDLAELPHRLDVARALLDDRGARAGRDFGDDEGAEQRVGERYYVGLLTADRQPHTLDIDSIAPRTRTNTNASDVRVMVCEGGMVGAASDESIHQTCHRVLPLRPGKITLSPTRTIMLEAVPHRRGQLVVDGSDVSYRDGWRRGSYPAGVFIEMKTTTG